MATSYMSLLKQARALAEQDIHRIVGKLQEFSQHFPDLVDKAVGAISPKGGPSKVAAATKVTAAPAAPVAKRKVKRLKQADAQALRELVKASLKGRIKQVDFIKKFVVEHPKYKAASVQAIIADFRATGAVKTEPVVKGNPLAGLYLMPGK